jgi:hypothetical protein
VSSRVDIEVVPGQGNTIKEIHRVKRQTFERRRLKAARDRKEKERRKEAEAQRFASSDKGRVRGEETKGGPGSEEQHSDSGNKTKKKKDSAVQGSLVDVIV